MEKEGLRVTPDGFLAHTGHPFSDNPRIERDFCENQVELITGVCDSPEAAWKELLELQSFVTSKLYTLETGREYLWPFSNPPYVRGAADIPIAHYEGPRRDKEIYRIYLAEKYGKMKMLFSGIHYNFSFSEEFLKIAYGETEGKTYREFVDELYLELAKKTTLYSWLLVYLTAASPVMDASYRNITEMKAGQDTTIVEDYASYRCSELGYWNQFVPVLDYQNMVQYVSSVENYIREGKLRAFSELYYPVRIKPKGENSLENLKQSGANHIELRMLDVNPLSPAGFLLEDMQFLHYFLLYLSSLPSVDFGILEQMSAIRNEKMAAHLNERDIWIEYGWGKVEGVVDAGLRFLSGMMRFYLELNMEKAIEVIQLQMNKLEHSENRYAVQIAGQYQREYIKKGLLLSERYARMAADIQDETGETYISYNLEKGKV